MATGCCLTPAALRRDTDLIRLAPETCAARPCDNVAADKTLAVEHFEKDAATCGLLWRAVFRLPRQRGWTMTLNLSLSEILAKLQQQIDSLREQVDLHARQEEHHRDQRALLEAELRKALGHLESFQAVAGTAAELDLPDMAPASPPLAEDLLSNPTLGRLVAWVVANRPEGERFGPRGAPPADSRSHPSQASLMRHPR